MEIKHKSLHHSSSKTIAITRLGACRNSETAEPGNQVLFKALYQLHSISSRFNVLNTPISTAAAIDAKTHVLWHCTMIDQRSILGHIQAKT
jgi:hypothetical protein